MLLIPAEKLASLSETEQQRHVSQLIEQLGVVEKGPPSQKRLQLLNYIGCIAGADTGLANHLVDASVLSLLAKQAREAGQHVDL